LNCQRIDPETGELLERIEMPVGVGVSGLESDGGDQQMTAHGFKGMASAIEMGC